MKLSNLLNYLDEQNFHYQLFGNKNVEVSGITQDSRTVKNGNIFVAIKGLHVDSHKLIPDAISSGASVIVGEEMGRNKYKDTPFIKVGNSRKALALLASAWYGNPAKKLKIIGITGTKGKTTTALILYNILRKIGIKVGVVSSIGAKIEDKDIDTGFHVTNPEPLFLQNILSQMVEGGMDYAILEVTSHGIDQERVAGIDFDIAILTNIAHEHLDYHKTFDNYLKTKSRLFINAKISVLNSDDPSFIYLRNVLRKKRKRFVTYSLKNNSDLKAQEIKYNFFTEFSLNLNNKKYNLRSRLEGEYNLYNIMAAVSSAMILDVSCEKIVDVLPKIKSPEGRLERVKNLKNLEIYIDFAHTPDSLENVLKLLSGKKKKRLISIFGCAGERDKTKRPLMGEISTRLADLSIFTAEDPRSEKTEDIIDSISDGAERNGAERINIIGYNDQIKKNRKRLYMRIPDRGEAITFAIQKVAQKDDTIVICGKGHEKSMCYDGTEHPWSDHNFIKNILESKGYLVAMVLAAGKGTRMNSQEPKVLQCLAGRPMVLYIVNTLRQAGFQKIIIVVGYKKDNVIKTVGPGVEYVFQANMLGTGDALKHSLDKIQKGVEDVLIVNGDDSAFYKEETIKEIMNLHKRSNAKVTFATLIKDDPEGLGRIVRDSKGNILMIVEEKEANDKERRIKEVNIGLYIFDVNWAKENIEKIKKSPLGEYYIVDLVKIAIKQKDKVQVFRLGDKNEWFGVNDKDQLYQADKKMRDSFLIK
jgi:UDP-N-acetylmuramoyl-L-alanyl-D-glutamate--2,6-diaminopimelate ligase